MKKFKDCSKEEIDKYCKNSLCKTCSTTCELYIANGHQCLKYFVEHKDLLSDKALNIELPIEDKILDDTEKEFLTQVVKLYDKVHCKIVSFTKWNCGKGYALSFRYIDKNGSQFRTNFPFFENKEMYKNIELDEPYTLEELGIEIPKHKITVNEFFQLKDTKKLAIHPRNEENAKALCKAFDEKGHHWFNGTKYVENNYYYNVFGKRTCYSNGGTYGDIDSYKIEGFTIIEFEDVDLS